MSALQALQKKGKLKAIDQAFEDLNPIITYRHLYAQNLGVRDPLRVIALCDSDAFYAACEMVRLGVDRETPLVVLQWDAFIAINYPARKFGISRLKKYNLKELQEKHPELMMVHVATYKEGEKEPGYWDDVDTRTHKVSLDYYRRESLKIAAMFKDCLPGCEIEKASIDEAFFDFSKRVREVILERHPYLAQVPQGAPKGVDTPLPPPPPIMWNDLGHLVPTKPPQAEEENSEVVHEVDGEEDLSTTWHDVALSICAELIDNARREVYEKLGYSTSAGIARNKFLAKLVASCKKPNNQSILRNAAIPTYLRPLPFQKIRFLGGKLGTAIAKEFEVSTVADLLSISLGISHIISVILGPNFVLEEMQQKFGEDSIWIYEVLRGIDRSEVREKSILNKSMLASKNLPKPITNASEGFHWIRVLAAELALRLNEARENSPNLWPKTVVLHTRRGYDAGRSKQAPFPFMRDVTVDTIAAAGNKLWKELVGTDLAMKVTNVQLAFTGIEAAEAGQRGIEDFLKTGQVEKPQRGEIDGDNDIESIPIVGNVTNEGNTLNTSVSRPAEGHVLSFTCSRCAKRIYMNALTIPSSPDDEGQLAALRLEHDDFHFAQDLAKQSGSGLVISGPSKRAASPNNSVFGHSRNSPNKKKRRGAPLSSGIEQFFKRT